MRRAPLWLGFGLAWFIFGLRPAVAGADDQIRAGMWEFSVLVPGVTHLPAGMENQGQVRLGPEGMTVSRAVCTSSDNPLPPMIGGPPTPRDADHPCKSDKTDVSGGTVHWSWSCTTDKVAVQSEGLVHYHEDALDGQFTIRTAIEGRPPIEKSQALTGRYLGPCGEK